MLISTVRLQNKGLQAYFEDDGSENDISDFEGFEFGPAMIKKPYDQFEGGRRKNRDDDMEGDAVGRRRRSDQAEKKQGCLQKILSLGSSDNARSRNDNDRTKFSEMTEAEKKERIDQLWNKARRYNNKLRF